MQHAATGERDKIAVGLALIRLDVQGRQHVAPVVRLRGGDSDRTGIERVALADRPDDDCNAVDATQLQTDFLFEPQEGFRVHRVRQLGEVFSDGAVPKFGKANVDKARAVGWDPREIFRDRFGVIGP